MSRGRQASIIVGLLVLLALSAVGVDAFISRGRIHRGVTALGVQLGGLAPSRPRRGFPRKQPGVSTGD